MRQQLKRQNTRLESEGAEFLVLGHLLILGIPAYKNYTNMPGYDIEATNPDKNAAARISVKSRWTTTATGFIIKNFNCDFVVVAKLNRGSRDGSGEVLPPEFFVLPVDIVKDAPRSKGWNRISFGRIPNFHSYRDRWDLIREFLSKPAKLSANETVLAIIKRSRKGVDKATLIKKTGFEGKKIKNTTYRLTKQGKIKKDPNGLYVKA